MTKRRTAEMVDRDETLRPDDLGPGADQVAILTRERDEARKMIKLQEGRLEEQSAQILELLAGFQPTAAAMPIEMWTELPVRHRPVENKAPERPTVRRAWRAAKERIGKRLVGYLDAIQPFPEEHRRQLEERRLQLCDAAKGHKALEAENEALRRTITTLEKTLRTLGERT